MKPRLTLALPALVIALAACSSSRHKLKKDVDAPAPLPAIHATLAVERLWSASVGGAKPVMRLGLGLGVDAGTVYAAGYDGDLAAFSLKTGRALWHTKTKKVLLSGGTGAGAGLVVVGSAKGDVLAFKAADGRAAWQVKVGGEVLSAPAVSEKVVVVRTVDGRLHALSTADGKELWREEQQIPRLTLRGTASPLIVGDAVYCGFDNGKVLALSLADGTKLWEATVSSPRGRTELERMVDVDSMVHVSGEDVFAVGFQGRAAMLARDSGQVWWSHEVSSYRGLDVDENGVVIATSGGQLLMLNRRNGIELWHNDSLARRRLSTPVLVGNYVAVVDLDGIVHWFDSRTGEALARSKAGDAVSSAPLSIDGVLVVLTDKGHIAAFRPGEHGLSPAASDAPAPAPAAAAHARAPLQDPPKP